MARVPEAKNEATMDCDQSNLSSPVASLSMLARCSSSPGGVISSPVPSPIRLRAKEEHDPPPPGQGSGSGIRQVSEDVIDEWSDAVDTEEKPAVGKRNGRSGRREEPSDRAPSQKASGKGKGKAKPETQPVAEDHEEDEDKAAAVAAVASGWRKMFMAPASNNVGPFLAF